VTFKRRAKFFDVVVIAIYAQESNRLRG
jgi:hypothetical protein